MPNEIIPLILYSLGAGLFGISVFMHRRDQRDDGRKHSGIEPVFSRSSPPYS